MGSVTWKYRMPSTWSCVLSRVMQTWLGTSSGISLRLCFWITLSMKGTTKFRPGERLAWYLPKRSTTQACCWGTTLTVLAMNRTARASNTTAISMLFSRLNFLKHEAIARDGGNAVQARAGVCAWGRNRCPGRAPVFDLCGALCIPGFNLNRLAHIQMLRGI